MKMWLSRLTIFFLISTKLFIPLYGQSPPATSNTSSTPLSAVVSAVVNIEVEHPKQTKGDTSANSEQLSFGSGFFVSKNGLVVTNAHVVAGASNIIIRNEEGNESIGRVIGLDSTMDIAVVQTSFNPSFVISLDNITEANVGDPVYAIGNAFGLPQSVSYGIVSALHRSISHPLQDFIQTDSAINQGNSGGPLVNQNGKLIGVNTMIIAVTGGNNGVGFAIPATVVSNIANQIIQYNNIQPGQIGVTIQNVSTDMASALGSPNAKGVVIADILPNSTAEKLALQPRDIIIEVNQQPVLSSSQVAAQVYSMRIGQPITVTILRAGKKQILKAKVQPPIDQTKLEQAKPSILSGVALTEFQCINTHGTQHVGLGVIEVKPGSPGWLAGMIPADLITKIGDQTVHELSDIDKIKITGPTIVEVIRKNKLLLLVLAPTRSTLP